MEDFAIGDMKFGRLAAELAQRGDGVVVEPLTLTSTSFSITGDATWAIQDEDPLRQRSELRLKLTSRDIEATLTALGYRPVVSGEKAEVTLELFWPGGPGQDILGTAGGRVRVRLDKGQVLGVEPGGGRLLGLFSIAALPRRLGMDFSDVVEEGLAFDRVQGEFRLDRGSAFTCNLGLEGPVTDLGGRGQGQFPGPDLRPAGRGPVPRVGRAGLEQHGRWPLGGRDGDAALPDLPQAPELARRVLLPGFRQLERARHRKSAAQPG